MNLTNLFNFNYLKQNVKKSKVILSIFIGLIPILNTIILIMEFDNNNNQVFNFQNISVINYIGIYFLPIIVSICLFNYVYKKKSVDFINSMPITRKSIFVTNTIFGIIIFLAMLIINIILLKVLTLIFGIQIPFMMFIDYLWFWFVVYMFVFSATNLAMSVSGNAITQIVLTLLIIFLVPFTTSFMKTINSQYKDVYLECTSDECMMESYYCYDNLECAVNKQLNLYKMYDARKIKKTNYTSPFAFINVFSYNNSSSIINFISVVKMIILTIIYIVLGYIMFLRRKMEVSETSFKNIHVHNIVRSLTLIPIIAIFYEILKEENLISIIFVLVLMLVYYFVYDLLTKKSINHIKISLIYFVLATTIITTTYGIVDKVGNEEDENILKYNDIKEIAIKLPNSYNEDKIYVNDKNILSTVIKSQSDMDMGIYVTSYIKTKNNEEYEIRNYLSKENYNKVLTLLSNNETYSKNYKQINNDKIFAVSVGRKIYSKKDSKKILDLVMKH